MLNSFDFYFVTDSALSKNGILSDVEQAVKAGCKIIQYREKNKSTKEIIEEAKKIKKMCGNKAIFLINDGIDIALAVNADGVHLGQDDMSIQIARKLLGKKIIGLTAHNVKEAKEAEAKGADYIGLSPIYQTSTKKDAGSACGTEMLTRVKNAVRIPVVAIGGINKENIREVIRAGADGAAAISAVLCKEDIYQEIKNFIEIIKEAKNDTIRESKK